METPVFTLRFSILLCYICCSIAAIPLSFRSQIPSFATFTPTSEFAFELSSDVEILVGTNAATGSPTAYDFAETFREDLLSVAHFSHIPPVQLSSSPKTSEWRKTVFIDIDPRLNFTLFSGKPTDEGYKIDITRSLITISASAPIGAFWGTRTLLQQIALSIATHGNGVHLPAGEVVDSPGWEVRGFMLDAGRHWFDTTFLCTFLIAINGR